MPLEARLLISLAVASAIVYWTSPIAVRLADRFQFYDRPVGYKGHIRPTPYLGGAAVVAGFITAVLLLGGEWGRTLPLLGGVAALAVVGTIDDRRTLRPSTRIAIEIGLAASLWAFGLGWDLHAGPVVDLAVTSFWIVAVVNAFNLFDNMDGAASSMGAVVAGGLAVFGVVSGNTWLAVCAAALCGACLGFLPHNLFASPARIFLGDGGSMPIGFAVAGLAMAGVANAALPWQSLAMGLLFVGIPALDTTLVMVSRRRRGLSIMTGGRDHLTHRTRARLRSAAAVAVALGGAQAVISSMAVVALRGEPALIVVAVIAYLIAAGVAITALDAQYVRTNSAQVGGEGISAHRLGGGWPSFALLVPLAAGLAVSPFFGGFYSSGLWVPIGLGLLAVATAGLIARPFRLSPPATLLLAGLGGLGVWSIASAAWSDAVEDAFVAGNRWLVYLVLVLLLLVAVRTERAAAWLLGLVSVFALIVAGTVAAWLLGSDPVASFLNTRLHEPLGYINGQGGFFLLAAWPCLAAAEQRRSALLSGAGMSAAVMFGALAMLSQSRGVALGFLISALVVLALVPGRVRRLWTLAALGASLSIALPAVLDLYDADLTADSARHMGRMALFAAFAGGVLWGGATALSRQVERRARWAQRAATGIAIALVILGVAALGVRAGSVADTVQHQYEAFIRLAPEASGQTSRLVSGAGHRYDYWRVAWAAFREQPLHGVGAGNYPRPYFEQRSTAEDVRQPHSIELQTLSELGVVGAALLFLLLAGIAWGAMRTARAAQGSPMARFVGVAGIGIVVAWFVQTSVDWMHLIPGVAGIALAAAVALVRVPAPVGAPAGPRRRLVLSLVAAIVLVLTAVSLSRQGLSERYRFEAQNALARDPARALVQADRSLRIDPDGLDAYYVKAAALARFDQGPAAVATLEEAARRAPGDFVTWALLGDLAVRMGDHERARRLYGRALALNPLDPSLQALVRDPLG